MKNIKEILALEKEYLIPSYSRADIAFVRGEGCRLWDTEGKSYLDFFTGIAVTSLGHCHPVVLRALQVQAKTLWHTSNLYIIKSQIEVAKKLSNLSNHGKVFFCNSGTEANEAAIKLARLYGKKIGQNKHTILSLENSFHGRTLGSLTATGQKKYREGFEPLVPSFKYVKVNDIDDLVYKADESVCAMIIEMIQGEGGINILSSNFVKKIFELAAEKQFLVIVDEVQTGLCKTGKFFAYQHFGVKPDIITLAKSLGNGFPVGAMIAKKDLSDLFSAGKHASTFGGNFLAMAVADAVLEVMISQKLDVEVRKKGKIFEDKLLKLKKKFSEFILEIRGLGFLRGIKLTDKLQASDVVTLCRKKGLICGTAGGNVIRLVPPLIVTEEEIDEAVSILDAVFTDILSEDKPLLGKMLSQQTNQTKKKRKN